jgi:hypothetical protein
LARIFSKVCRNLKKQAALEDVHVKKYVSKTALLKNSDLLSFSKQLLLNETLSILPRVTWSSNIASACGVWSFWVASST